VCRARPFSRNAGHRSSECSVLLKTKTSVAGRRIAVRTLYAALRTSTLHAGTDDRRLKRAGRAVGIREDVRTAAAFVRDRRMESCPELVLCLSPQAARWTRPGR